MSFNLSKLSAESAHEVMALWNYCGANISDSYCGSLNEFATRVNKEAAFIAMEQEQAEDLRRNECRLARIMECDSVKDKEYSLRIERDLEHTQMWYDVEGHMEPQPEPYWKQCVDDITYAMNA